MAELRIDGDSLVVHMSAWERTVAFSGAIRVPVAAVRSVWAEASPWPALRGIRAPGTGIPGVLSYGVRRMTGGRPDFAAVLRNRPVVCVELDPPSQFERLVVSVPDAEEAVARVRAAAGL